MPGMAGRTRTCGAVQSHIIDFCVTLMFVCCVSTGKALRNFEKWPGRFYHGEMCVIVTDGLCKSKLSVARQATALDLH